MALSHASISSGVVLSIFLPLNFPRRKSVCMIRLPLNCLRLLMSSSADMFIFGWLCILIVSSRAESSLRIFWSTFSSACLTAGTVMAVEFDSTAILASGKYLFRSLMLSSIIPGKSGCMVGSPFPAYVITSGAFPFSFISASFASSAS